MQASGKAGCENSTANVVSAGHDEGANLGLVESTNSGSFQASPETYKKPVSNEGSSGGSDHNAMHVGARSGSGNCDRLVDSALPSTTNYNKSACNSKEVKLALTVGNGARSLANKSSTKGCDTRTAPTSKQCNCKDTKCSKEHIAALIVEMDGERKRVIQPQSHGNDVERVEETMLLPLKISPFAKRDTFEGWNINNRSVRQCSKINKLAALGCDNNTKYQEHDPSKQDKENMHPVNLIVLKTGTVEASRTSRSSTTLKQLNMNITQTQRGHQQRRVKTSSTYFMKPCFKLVRSRPFHPPTANKPLSASKYRSCHETGRSTTSRTKKQKITANEAKPFIYKKLLRISLAALTRLHDDPCVSSGVLKLPRFQVLRLITARNAHRVRFGQDGCLNCSLDEAYDTTTFLGPRELYRKLKAGNYILERMNATFEWFLNHYRWIVWKLAATERAFPRLLLSNYLTQDQVMKQITYRYQRDLNEAKRSILKKMLQREASATNCMVLCVAAVLPFSSDSVEAIDPELPAFWNMALVLTDGWYSVYAVPDAPLAAVLWKLHSKSHLVGTKLATWNATLHNSTEGIDPLECAIVRESEWRNPLLAKEDLTQWPYLQLRCNSTRRARFETRLGVENLHHLNLTESRRGEQQPHLLISLLKSIPLKSLEIGGGMVRSVRIRVTRISPILHLQSKEWTLGPRILCEEQLPLYFQLRSEYAQAVMQKAYTRNDEDSRVDNYLNGDQINVPLPIPFIKVDVECTHSSPEQGTGILTIWRPSDDLLSGGLREGAEYYVSSLTVNWKVDGGRGQNAFVRLSSTKHSGFEEINDHGSLLNNITRDETSRQNQHRVCLNVQQATMNYRNEFENKTNVRSDESRPKIDICVCVVLVTNRETQDVSRSMTPNKSDVSLLDPETKPHESRYVEYVFVTDHSRHLMSIRVTGMEVSMPTKSSNQKSKHSSPSSIHFRRGSKICWKEGAILCLSGLEVSHYDEQLRVLDCVLVESTQIVSFPSKKSSFWNNFQLLQREVGNDPVQGSTVQATFSEELDKLREYVKRAILQLNCISSQESHEHHIETAEQEKLTQELLAHEGDTTAAVEQKRFSDSSAFQMWWDVKVVRIIPLYGPTRPMFSRSVEFIAYVSVGSSGVSFRTLYLTQEVMLALQSLLKQAAVSEGTNGNTTKNITVLQNVQQMLCSHKKHHGDYTFCFEVHQVKNEWLVNSWRPWQRLHAEYWIATTVTASHLGS
ncbi:putative breast cancer type 2 susceptibility protein [Plasmopara halstedii]